MALKKWIDLATYYKQVRTLFNGIFLFLGVIVFFMVLMSSVNTLLMAMFERTREIGTMLAMGTPRTWIVALFMLEATLLGHHRRGRRAWSEAICSARSSTPPAFTCRRRRDTRSPIAFQRPPRARLMIGSSLLVIVSLALASIFPAIRASRLQIAEALAHV